MADCDTGSRFDRLNSLALAKISHFELGMAVGECPHAWRQKDVPKPIGSLRRTVPVIGCPSLLTAAFAKM